MSVQAGGAIVIHKMVGGVETALTSASYDFSAGTFYNVWFVVQDDIVVAKIWAEGTSEPSSWTLGVYDSSLTGGGRAAVSAYAPSGATVTFDDYVVATIGGGGNQWSPPPGYAAILDGAVDGDKTLTMFDGTVFTFAYANNPGQYATSITNKAGRVVNVDYSTIATDGKVKLTDALSGRQIRLSTTGGVSAFRITAAEVSNPAGGNYVWTYGYDTTIPADPRLTQVCEPSTPTACRSFQYHPVTAGYGSRLKLHKILDGYAVAQVEVTYGVTSRVTELKNAFGDAKKFQYSQQAVEPFDITAKLLDERYAATQANWDTKSWQHVTSTPNPAG